MTPITSVPFTITAPGVYSLTGDLTTNIATGAAITINANQVVIDLNGYRLGGGLAGLGTQASGIYALNQKNITIRNGTIRGFQYAVRLEFGSNSAAHIIEKVRAEDNTQFGIWVGGVNCVIRSNSVSNTGGSTAVAQDSSCGIYVLGTSNRIVDNDVMYCFAGSPAAMSVGIEANSGENSVVEYNRVSNLVSTSGNTCGVRVLSANGIIIARNRINGSAAGAPLGGTGIELRGTAGAQEYAVISDNIVMGSTSGIAVFGSSVVCSGNISHNCNTPYTGCTPGGVANYP